MDFQTVIVGLIVLLASIYVGKTAITKVKSFSRKEKNCGSDCGCGDKSTGTHTQN